MKLVPMPHTIRSIRSQKWTVGNAIAELIDNSFGKGEANSIWIDVADDHVRIMDDGTGFEDINSAAQLGNSKSFEDRKAIGQFGVGLTHAAIWAGDILKVDTVHNGILKSHTVNWGKVLRDMEWPDGYEGEGKPAVSPVPRLFGGRVKTVVEIRKLAIQRISVDQLTERIQELFSPGLRKGKEISIRSTRGNNSGEWVKIDPARPETIGVLRVIMGSIKHDVPGIPNPLYWDGLVGRTVEPLKHSQRSAQIIFDFRAIENTQDVWSGFMPSTLLVEVDLDFDWKHTLTAHKDGIAESFRGIRSELMRSVRAEIMPELEEERKEAETLYLDGLSNLLHEALVCLEPAVGTATGEEVEAPVEHHTETPIVNPAMVPVVDPLELAEPVSGVKVSEEDDCPRKVTSNKPKFQVIWQTQADLGNLISLSNFSEDDVTVALNKDSKIVQSEILDASKPVNLALLLSLVADSIATTASTCSELVLNGFLSKRPSLRSYLEADEDQGTNRTRLIFAWIMGNVQSAKKKGGRPKKAAVAVC